MLLTDITNFKGGIMRDYSGNDNYGKPRQDYFDRVKAMPDKELSDETEMTIWLSAYAANNPRSDFHWQTDACYDAWASRGDLHGYEKAWKRASGQ
jgi:ADP-ribosylglycohydrolase